MCCAFSIIITVFFHHTIAITYYGNVTIPINGTFTLNGHDKIYSKEGNTFLLMQLDGNCVLYDSNINPLWSSDTLCTNEGNYVSINFDGKIQIKNATDHILWQTDTHSHVAAQPHTLYVYTDCAYLMNKYNDILYHVGSGCCALFQNYTTEHKQTISTQSHVFVNDECLPIDEISWVGSYQIAWINVVSCTETNDVYTYHYDKTTVFNDLAPSVISVKIEPFGGTSNPEYEDFAVIAIPYSNPVYALRNNIEMTYLYDPNTNTIYGSNPDTSSWIGSCTAIDRLSGGCVAGGAPYNASVKLWQACGNQAGLHLDNTCEWDYESISGQNITLYFGFELIDCPSTHHPTKYPSQSPTIPTNDPTTSPTIPTNDPTTSPTIPTNEPIASPTQIPSLSPTDVPSFLPTDVPSLLPTHIPSSFPTTHKTRSTMLVPVEGYQDRQISWMLIVFIALSVGIVIVSTLITVLWCKMQKRKTQVKPMCEVKGHKDANEPGLSKVNSVSVSNDNMMQNGENNTDIGEVSVNKEGVETNMASDEFEIIGDDEIIGKTTQ